MAKILTDSNQHPHGAPIQSAKVQNLVAVFSNENRGNPPFIHQPIHFVGIYSLIAILPRISFSVLHYFLNFKLRGIELSGKLSGLQYRHFT